MSRTKRIHHPKLYFHCFPVAFLFPAPVFDQRTLCTIVGLSSSSSSSTIALLETVFDSCSILAGGGGDKVEQVEEMGEPSEGGFGDNLEKKGDEGGETATGDFLIV